MALRATEWKSATRGTNKERLSLTQRLYDLFIRLDYSSDGEYFVSGTDDAYWDALISCNPACISNGVCIEVVRFEAEAFGGAAKEFYIKHWDSEQECLEQIENYVKEQQ